MSPSMPSMTATSSRDSISAKASAGTPAEATAERRMPKRARLERFASEPPLRATAFPDFRQSDITCGTTSGRDSNTIPMRPMGHLTLYTLSPSSISSAESVSPTGSGRDLTLRMLATISSILAPSTLSLFSIWRGTLPSHSKTSSAFAARTSVRRASSAEAMASRAWSFASADREAMAGTDLRTARMCASESDIRRMSSPPDYLLNGAQAGLCSDPAPIPPLPHEGWSLLRKPAATGLGVEHPLNTGSMFRT